MFTPFANVKEFNMNIQAFLDSDPIIQAHMLLAVAALFIGLFVFWKQKGTPLHRRLGKLWVALMISVSLTGLFIHEIRMWGLFSPIHVFSVFVPISLAIAILYAKTGRVSEHKRTMIANFVGGNLIAGGFTFLPGRLNHDIFLADFLESGAPGISLVWLSIFAGFTIFVVTFVSVRRATLSVEAKKRPH